MSPPSPDLPPPPPRELVCTGQATKRNAFLLLVLYIAIGWRETELRVLCLGSSIRQTWTVPYARTQPYHSGSRSLGKLLRSHSSLRSKRCCGNSARKLQPEHERIHFFCSCSNFPTITRLETLATLATLIRAQTVSHGLRNPVVVFRGSLLPWLVQSSMRQSSYLYQ